jgi:3-oxoacyl-[acyl-carrier-protein] synthase II
MTHRLERIAITGLGIVSALGSTAASTFERMARGECALNPLRTFDASAARARLAAEVPARFLESVPEVAGGFALSPSDRLAAKAAREALEQAVLVPEAGGAGLSIGGTTGGLAHAEAELFASAGAGPERARRFLTHPLSATARALDALYGPFARSSSVCSACSSGALAIVEAASWLLSGELEWALAGGVDGLCRLTLAGFDALGALDPEPCRPFDVNRRGLTLGEGAAFLVLEPESRARARGVRILGWLGGFAIGSEAHHVTHPEPSGRRAAELMGRALSMAGRSERDIDYVNAHGTGTPANDSMEAKALRAVLRNEVGRIRVSSCKGQLGHTLGAAGALEAALTLLSLERQLVLPTGGLAEPEDAGLGHVLGRGADAELRAALSSSFGFGGMNAVLLLEHADQPARAGFRRTEGAVITGAVALGVELDPARGTVRPAELPADPLAQLDPERSRRFDRGAATVTWATGRALEQARISPDGVGLTVGNAYGIVERSIAFLDRLRERGPRFCPPAEFPQLVHSALAGNASIYLGLRGPIAGVCGGELSAPAALARALSWLELEQAPAIVAGALEARDAVVDALFELEGGGVRGEGGGFLLVEPAARARQRGQSILATLAAHVEERAGFRDPRAWRAPASENAALVLAPSDPSLSSVVAESAWRAVRRYDLGGTEGVHEARSGAALALGAELAAAGVREVLIVCGKRSARFVTRLESAGEAG